MIKCHACACENQDGSAYCEDCGAKLFSQASKPSESSLISPGKSMDPPSPTHNHGLLAQLTIEGVVFPLPRNSNSIGRRSPADGVYPDVDLTDFDQDSYISRRHAQILKEASAYYFEDLGSANGSYVNGELMMKGAKQLLKDGDLIKLGKTEVIFSFRKK